MFTKTLAEAYKSRAGQKYKPSNGNEGIIFMEYFCDRCQHNDEETLFCDLISLSLAHQVTDKDYPQEWQYGKDGQPVCTRFKEK